jgi:hypothetical protein
MTPSEAAAAFLSLQPVADAISSELEAAKKVLKAHLAGRKTAYKGITTSSGGSKRLDNELVKQVLGPKKLEECKRFVPSTSLVLPSHLRKGAVVLEHKLVPVGQADESASA